MTRRAVFLFLSLMLVLLPFTVGAQPEVFDPLTGDDAIVVVEYHGLEATITAPQRGINLNFQAPLQPFTGRNSVDFKVCGGGVLWQAFDIAAREINEGSNGGYTITLTQSNCQYTAGLRNNVSEIYYADVPSIARHPNAVGLYTGYLGLDGSLIEDNILIKPTIDDFPALLNLARHELGHAVVFDHTVGDRDCGVTVMHPYLCDTEDLPFADVEFQALKRLFPASNRGPSPAPRVAQFDNNGNGVIDNNEFFNAHDAWIDGAISNGLFFEIVDYWISGESFAVSTQGAQALTYKDADKIMLFTLDGAEATDGWMSQYQLRRAMSELPRGTYVYLAEAKIGNSIIHWRGFFLNR